MLTLTRKPGEAIIIETAQGPIEVVVTDVRGRAVRLGIKAPREMTIYRSELLRRGAPSLRDDAPHEEGTCDE